jgi:CheY-like chemotaxis protein
VERQRPRVLLIDDNEATLQTLSFALRAHFSVWTARNASHAIEVAEELDWDADAIVTDLNLGAGLRGDQFAAYYRERQKSDTPVVLMTGASEIVDLHAQARIAVVRLKPVDLESLIPVLWSLIRRDRGWVSDSRSPSQ